MKVSVTIPAYNCETTIEATVDSVLHQSLAPHEILVMDDGSTDGTAKILQSYGPKITVYRQPNGGLSSARNALIAKSRGELISFLDSDDLMHPKYLEAQTAVASKYPNAAALFSGHINIYGDNGHCWSENVDDSQPVECIPGATFFKQYNHSPGAFTSYSFCCIPKRVLTELGPEPFKADGAEDFYCSALLSLVGPIVYNPAPLVAYRVRPGSVSSNRLAGLAARVHAFELLESRFRALKDIGRSSAFADAFASHRRSYAKYLLGAERLGDARTQLWCSTRNGLRLSSIAKSIGMLSSTYLPKAFQPVWPTTYQR